MKISVFICLKLWSCLILNVFVPIGKETGWYFLSAPELWIVCLSRFFLFQNFCLFEKVRLNNATLINLRLMAPLQRRQGRLPGGNDESIAFVVCSMFVCFSLKLVSVSWSCFEGALNKSLQGASHRATNQFIHCKQLAWPQNKKSERAISCSLGVPSRTKSSVF